MARSSFCMMLMSVVAMSSLDLTDTTGSRSWHREVALSLRY